MRPKPSLDSTSCAARTLAMSNPSFIMSSIEKILDKKPQLFHSKSCKNSSTRLQNYSSKSKNEIETDNMQTSIAIEDNDENISIKIQIPSVICQRKSILKPGVSQNN